MGGYGHIYKFQTSMVEDDDIVLLDEPIQLSGIEKMSLL
jgi:hypothetical protein